MAKKRYLILSDIHSNEEALGAVLRCVSRRRYDGILCLGDLVGYGANPNQVVFVFACANPTPHLRMLDRFLVIAERQGIPALIAATSMRRASSTV